MINQRTWMSPGGGGVATKGCAPSFFLITLDPPQSHAIQARGLVCSQSRDCASTLQMIYSNYTMTIRYLISYVFYSARFWYLCTVYRIACNVCVTVFCYILWRHNSSRKTSSWFHVVSRWGVGVWLLSCLIRL